MHYQKHDIVAVEFPDGWEHGWTVEAITSALFTDIHGKIQEHQVNLSHPDGRKVRGAHPNCVQRRWRGESGQPGLCYYCGKHRSLHREGKLPECEQG
jgi:hypothetical protein